MRAIAADTGHDRPLDDSAVDAYLSSLERLMVIENQPAWSTHLRSRSRLRSASKRHFVDPSLAAAALRTTPGRLFDEPGLLGQLFESLVWRDLSVHARACDARLHHYRDNTGLEVDMVVETGAGAWCAFEVKLAANQADAGAATLLRFRERVDTGRADEPAMLGVIVASGPGYMRRDGVAVIPVGALGP